MSYAIVTPIWKESLTDGEFRNVSYTFGNIFNIDRYFVHPAGMSLKYYTNTFRGARFIAFEESYFENVSSYSRLMLTSDFYRAFDAYMGIVICQTDAIMLRGIPDYVMDFDYVGAPWCRPFRLNRERIIGRRRLGWLLSKLNVGELVYVGNGGLSWRRVKAFLDIEKHMRTCRIQNSVINEDLLIAYLGARGLLDIPSPQLANDIFVEEAASNMVDSSRVIGFHALEKFNPDLLKLILKDFYT
jgi:hypothetical protein